MRPHKRVGIWLSGGVDSSVVAAAAVSAWQRLARDPADLVAYHLLLAEGQGESALAKSVAHGLGLALRWVRRADGDPFDGAETLYGKLDVPVDAGGPATALKVARRMRDDGIGVFLTGDGGDEVFGPLSRRSLAGRLRVVLRDHSPMGIRQRLSRHVGPAWVVASRPRPHHVRSWPRARRGLRGERARRDRVIRCPRQTVIMAYSRAVAEIAEASFAAPLLDPSVVELAVRIAPDELAAEPAKGVARAAYADLLPGYTPPSKVQQPSLTGPMYEDVRRYGGLWVEQWISRRCRRTRRTDFARRRPPPHAKCLGTRHRSLPRDGGAGPRDLLPGPTGRGSERLTSERGGTHR